jgi:hypothetical protein
VDLVKGRLSTYIFVWAVKYNIYKNNFILCRFLEDKASISHHELWKYSPNSDFVDLSVLGLRSHSTYSDWHHYSFDKTEYSYLPIISNGTNGLENSTSIPFYQMNNGANPNMLNGSVIRARINQQNQNSVSIFTIHDVCIY